MKIFEVTINGWAPETVHATKARIAVNKAMTFYKESAFTPCGSVKVRCIGTVKYTFVVKAICRNENGSTEFKRLPIGPYKKRKDAVEAASVINTTARQSRDLPTCEGAKVYRLDEQMSADMAYDMAVAKEIGQ